MWLISWHAMLLTNLPAWLTSPSPTREEAGPKGAVSPGIFWQLFAQLRSSLWQPKNAALILFIVLAVHISDKGGGGVRKASWVALSLVCVERRVRSSK